ncbi:hypothetical protein PJL15_02904 [Paenarthrobacter nitroguajacolicus]|nr:hypothetical protein [Paenarthrobacter nitroguajacolicus]
MSALIGTAIMVLSKQLGLWVRTLGSSIWIINTSITFMFGTKKVGRLLKAVLTDPG